jgi:phenylacetate-CoA ligase
VSFFHPRSLPGAAWPSIPYPNVSLIWAAYHELDRTQWLKPEELEHAQLRQVRALLKHCTENVPYYADLLRDVGPVETIEDFRRIPRLTRELYQQNFATIQATALPDGMTATGSPSFTSGTNGVPIPVLKSNRNELWWMALCLRDLEWCGMDPRKRVAGIRLLAMKPEDLPAALEGISAPSWFFDPALAESGPTFGMDLRQDPRKQLAWLRAVRPSYLISLPSNLEVLAGLVEESGSKLRALETIQAIGEPLPDELRLRIEAAFGVPVKNLYSTMEAGFMASQCPEGHGLHVHSENILAEVLDEHNLPCAPGETGRLVFTTLHNFVAPFIRYEVLDDVTLAPGPCPCGRGLPLWSRVDGRQHPMLVLPSGARRSSIGLTLGLRQIGGVLQFQFVQRAVEYVVVRVVPSSAWTSEHAARMKACVQAEFESPIRVDVEVLPFLPRPASGKLKLASVEVMS